MLAKVVIYITQGKQLLVFHHTQHPEAGLQVPAGTVEAGEDLRQAAFREAAEETGLAPNELLLRDKLGSDHIRARTKGDSLVIQRHFYHFEFVGQAPATWIHYENDPSDDSPAPIEFEFFWLKYPGDIPDLAGKQGAMLGKLHLSG